MRSTSIFNNALRKLTIVYVWLALFITLTFTVPALVTTNRVHNKKIERDDRPALDINTGMPANAISDFETRWQRFVERRDIDLNKQVTRSILQINGLMLLLAVFASYWFARRTLEPLHDVLETQERFAAELAHELKTPLATVLMQLETFIRHEDITEKQKSELRRLAHSIKGVGDISEQTLSLMAVDHLKPESMKDCDLNEITTAVTDAIAPATAAKNISLSLKLPKKLIVRGYSTQLRQLIGVLVDNAVKFTPEHGKIMIIGRETEKTTRLTVKDTGPGIAPFEQAKIFERWHQASTETSGSGLGLSIAQRIADAHGAKLMVRSQPGKGASFIIKIPHS